MWRNTPVELMAPAGSFACLRAAIAAGCDSVYFGVAGFNMRATATSNFSLEELNEAVELCHGHGIKAYITVNTLLYDNELDKMRKVVDAVIRANADAIIAADMAAVLYAFGRIELHLSTQLSVSNLESVKFYAQYVDRIVLARELDLKQVGHITQKIREQGIKGPSGELVEIEIFAHGALCVAVSGRCGMSLFSDNKSASRGRCTQICRRVYEVIDPETGLELKVDNNYVMSSADLCTIGMLDELVATGVNVLKIEGRGRSPMYVDVVIRTYREALDTLASGTYSQVKVDKWLEQLSTVFNRHFSPGMYRGRKLVDWACSQGNEAALQRVQLGKIDNYYSNIQVALLTIKAKEQIKAEDEYIITGPTTGILRDKFGDLLIDDEPVARAGQGDAVTFKVRQKVRKNDLCFVLRQKT